MGFIQNIGRTLSVIKKMISGRAKNQVVKALLSAFNDTTSPEGDKIVYPEGVHYDDVLELRDRLTGVDWRQIGRDSESVEIHRNDEFSFLTTSAMRYFLPGYILACLKDPFAADVLMDRVLNMFSQCALERPVRTAASGGHDLAEMISSMTPAQIHAIVMFVDFVFQYHPEYSENADEILEYWHKVE